jgi:integrase
MNLTDDKVGKLKLSPDEPDGKIFFDDKISGLGVRCYSSGRKTWLYQFRLAGRSYKYEIGSTEKILASKARAEAKVAAGHVANRVNPIDVRRQAEAKHRDKFGDLVDEYLKEKQSPTKPGKKPVRPRSYAEIERHLKTHCASFEHRPIHGITQRDVGELYKNVSREAGSGAASHTWSTLRAFMHWAMRQGVIEKNVAALYDGGGTNPPRDRKLLDTELAIVWKACRDDQFGNVIRLLILTGARRDEVGHLPISEIVLDKREWVLASERSKNGRAHLVPLTEAALAILKVAVETRETFVFGYGDERGFSGWSKAKKALDKRIADAGHQLEPWTLHDLRRTFATGLQKLKIEPHIIEACLNHSPPKLQRVYQLHDYAAEKLAALNRWAAHVDAVVTGKTIDNVVSIKGAAS